MKNAHPPLVDPVAFELAADGLAQGFWALARTYQHPVYETVLQKVAQLSFELNSHNPRILADLLGLVGDHAGRNHRELGMVSLAFHLAGCDMARQAQRTGQATQGVYALQFYALATLALPVRDDGQRNLEYSPAYPLQISLRAAAASLAKPFCEQAMTLNEIIRNGLSPVYAAPRAVPDLPPAVPKLALAADTYIKTVWAEQHAPF